MKRIPVTNPLINLFSIMTVKVVCHLLQIIKMVQNFSSPLITFHSIRFIKMTQTVILCICIVMLSRVLDGSKKYSN